MIKSYRVVLTPTARQIVRESEPVSVRLNFAGLTGEVYIGDAATLTAENGFPLKNEDFKFRNWEFVVINGADKFAALSTSDRPVTLNVLVMSLPAGSVAMASSPPSQVQRIATQPVPEKPASSSSTETSAATEIGDIFRHQKDKEK
ncbi:MAG: hypothetical protein ABWY25_01455 [Paenisporosarcina sp.]